MICPLRWVLRFGRTSSLSPSGQIAHVVTHLRKASPADNPRSLHATLALHSALSPTPTALSDLLHRSLSRQHDTRQLRRPLRPHFLPRPRPFHPCADHGPNDACSAAPCAVISPPFTAGLSNCTHCIYEGHAYTDCAENYCTRDVLPSETAPVACPLGLLTTITD